LIELLQLYNQESHYICQIKAVCDIALRFLRFFDFGLCLGLEASQHRKAMGLVAQREIHIEVNFDVIDTHSEDSSRGEGTGVDLGNSLEKTAKTRKTKVGFYTCVMR